MVARLALLLLLLTLALAGLLAAAPPFGLDLGAPDATRASFGFYDAEQSEGVSFRWSGPQARFVFHGSSPGAQLLTLRLSGERLVELGDPTLGLEGDAGPVANFAVREGWRRYQVLLPPGATSDGLGVARPLRLRTALNRPGDTGPGGADERRLGVPVAWVSLQALDGQWPSALARAVALTWMLGLAAALALHARSSRGSSTTDDRRPTTGGQAARRSSVVGGRSSKPGRDFRLAVLAALVLGAGLLLVAWRDPYGLAWALPPPWWTLATATVVAAVLVVAPLQRPEPTRNWLFAPPGRLALPGTRRGLWLAGALALAAGAAILWVGGSLWVGGLLALGGLWALLHGDNGLGAMLWPAAPAPPRLAPSPEGEAAHRRPHPWDLPRSVAWAGLALTLLIALGLRLYRLDELPFGLWRDEARHGLFALRIAQNPDYRPIYIASERVNMPALGLYPFALALHLWGPHLWTMRAVTAVAGALTVLPLYALAHALCGRRSVALGAALLLAVSSWHITISRFSFPTVFDPLLTLTGLWLILIALTSPPWWRALLMLAAGVCLGLAVQTYHTGRVAPVVGAALVGLLLFFGAGRPAWPGWRALLGILPLAIGGLLVAAPLLSYAAGQPAAFNDRVGAVFVLGEAARKGLAPLSVLDDALRRHLLMFNYLGDANGRHHAPLRPLLDLVAGVGLLAGLAAALRTWRTWRSLFLLAALVLSLAPSLLAVDAPHAMRAFGAASFAYLLAALGWAELLRLVWPQPAPRDTPQAHAAQAPPRRAAVQGLSHRAGALGAVAALAVLAAGLNIWTYFGLMPGDPRVFMGFYPVQSRMGVFVRETGGAELVYVPLEVRDDPSFAFLAAGLPVGAFDPAAPPGAAPATPPPAPGATFLLSGYFAEAEAAALAPILGPAATPIAPGDPFPDGRGPTFYLYRAR